MVAVDIDGTLGNYYDHFVLFAENYLNQTLPRDYDGGEEFSEYLGLEKRLYRDIKLAYRQGGMKRSMPVFSGADKFMRDLRDLGVEIWITTTRPWQRLDNVDPDTRHWLERNRMPYDRMVYDEDKYQQLVSLIDPLRVVLVVEDLLEQCRIASGLWLPVWQPERPFNDASRYIRQFTEWGTCIKVVEETLKERWSLVDL